MQRPVASLGGAMNTQRSTALVILAMMLSCPVLAEEPSAGAFRQSYAPSFGVIMGVAQLRHFKLWYAGNVRNWPLADYELGQIKASFEDATKLYPNLPAADMSSMTQPADEISSAIKAKDGMKFEGV